MKDGGDALPGDALLESRAGLAHIHANVDWIVCGWYTPDYKVWADALIRGLEANDIPHDIVAMPKLPGGWEANTMGKADHVLGAMDRHPDKMIIFLDVDCEVRGDLAPLASGTRGDVAFMLFTKARRRGVRIKVHSATLVIRPTPEARRFVEAWAAASKRAQWGDIDQTTLAIAMATTPGVTIEPLEPKWCAECQMPDSVIVHANASRDAPKVRNTWHRLWWLWSLLRTLNPVSYRRQRQLASPLR